jgi:NTP pyrophosphatase (non-canonical NTP hydrolase)
MREFFSEHEDFEAERPTMKHSPIWWLEKMQEEWAELYVITSNDPLEQDKPQMGKELADVFWTMVGYAKSIGITPTEFEDNAISKMDSMHQTYPVELFDGSIPFLEGYRLARPDKVKPKDIFNPSVSAQDELID